MQGNPLFFVYPAHSSVNGLTIQYICGKEFDRSVMSLPINIEDLLYRNKVESTRVEFIICRAFL